MIADIKSEDKLSYPYGLLTYNASTKLSLGGIKFKTLSSGNTGKKYRGREKER
jgi:hypothetical protein